MFKLPYICKTKGEAPQKTKKLKNMKNNKINIGDNVRLIGQSSLWQHKAGVVIDQLSKTMMLVTILKDGIEMSVLATKKELELI